MIQLKFGVFEHRLYSFPIVRRQVRVNLKRVLKRLQVISVQQNTKHILHPVDIFAIAGSLRMANTFELDIAFVDLRMKVILQASFARHMFVVAWQSPPRHLPLMLDGLATNDAHP